MLYKVFFAQIKFSVDSLYPVHCPRTSILDFLKIGQVLLSPCSLHIYIYTVCQKCPYTHFTPKILIFSKVKKCDMCCYRPVVFIYIYIYIQPVGNKHHNWHFTRCFLAQNYQSKILTIFFSKLLILNDYYSKS